MKLATALMNRADLQKKMDELHTRLNLNAKVQEGEEPAEQPAELLAELDAAASELEELVTRINLTNAQTVTDGLSITARIAHRDTLMKKQRILRSFLDEASNLASRYSRTEIKIQSTVHVRDLQKKLDAVAQEIRLTDEKLQELNWTVELL
ncbi:MAG: DIP1984 family protein [Oscillospiraceae bacterium]|nr:DIP1984 family protein [Oscillospiraceae bacterium]